MHVQKNILIASLPSLPKKYKNVISFKACSLRLCGLDLMWVWNAELSMKCFLSINI